MTEPQTILTNSILLDNPVWSALSTVQEHFAEGDRLARRFPPDVSPFGAIVEPSAAAYKALEQIAGEDTVALCFLERPVLPRPWETVLEIDVLQMICDRPAALRATPGITDMKSFASMGKFRRLTSRDIPAMLELTSLTEPGPFRDRTIEMGTYLGMDEQVDGPEQVGNERLIAMAGERMRMTGFTEVSAVCTHPDFRGRGYSYALVSAVIARIAARGETAILHVKTENAAAVRVYERLGFSVRTRMLLVAIKRSA